MLLIWWRRESCLFQKDCRYYRTTTGRNSGLPNSAAQWRHDGSGTTAAASAEESWAAARAPTIIPGHFQTKCINTHTQNRQLPQRHHSPLFILLKKILLSRYHLVVVDGMTHKTHNIFWGQMNDFVVSRTCPKLGHIFQKRSRTQSGMR